MKVSELCRMIEDSARSGRYPLDTDAQKKLAPLLQVTSKTEPDDLKAPSVVVETRVQDLYVVNNYVQNIQHLPGVIEVDVMDSFKMLCRRIERIDSGVQIKR
jgi:hypothetical protein